MLSLPKPLIRLLMVTAASGLCGAQESLQSAWSQLLQENAELASAEKRVLSEQAQLENAKALRLPTVNFTSQYTILNDDITLSIDTGIPGIGSIDYTVQDSSYWDSELTTTLPIYTGGRITAAIEAEQADIQNYQAQTQEIEDRLFTTFVRRYLGVELAQQNLATRQLALNNLEQHLQRTIRMEEEGALPHTARLQSEVERDRARREWQQAEDRYQLALSAYQALFHSDAPQPSQPLTYVEMPILDQDEIIERALGRSPILQQIDSMQAKAQAGLKAANGEKRPTVALFGMMELARDDLTALEPEWAVGASLQWQLYGGGNRNANIDSYRYLSESAELRAQQVRRDLSLYTKQALLNIDSAKNMYLSLESSKTLAEENLRLQQKAFLQGVNTALDEVDAHLIVTGIELQSHRALYDYYTAIADLAALTGDIETYNRLMTELPATPDLTVIQQVSQPEP